jgi:methionyl-tRNA formyltransferase
MATRATRDVQPAPERYLVCGCTPWARDVYDRVLSKLPGAWEYVDLPRNWRRIIAEGPRPRYAFFLHWRWKVPADVLADVECVGFHLGTLQYERGGSPLQWRILTGQHRAALSMFRMTEQLDWGPLYATGEVHLEGPAEACYRRAMDEAAAMIDLLLRTPEAARGTHPIVTLRGDDKAEGKVWPRRTPEEGNLARHGAASLEALHDRIRCVDAPGYPLAYLRFPGFRVEFRRAVNYGDRIEADVTITRDEETDPA